MNLKESLMELCGDAYDCLEWADVGGVKVLTIGTEKEPYVLNFEIGDASISVNVIDRPSGSVVEEYEDTFGDEGVDSCVSNAVMTYESIVKNKAKIKEAQHCRAQKETFDAVLSDGSPEAFSKLSKEELEAFVPYIDENVEDGLGKKLAHYAVQSALDAIDSKSRKSTVTESFKLGDKVKVDGDDRVGQLTEYIDEDPMDSATGHFSGDFVAWVVRYDDGSQEMADEDHITLVESGEGSFNELVINVGRGLNADGFKATVLVDGEQEWCGEYYYGYTASYDPRFANAEKPYVTDIIKRIMKEYDVAASNIRVVAGKNVFKDTDVSSKEVSDFISKYISGSITESIELNEDANAITNRVDIPCENGIVIVAEMRSLYDDHYEADYIAGLRINDELNLTVDGKSGKYPINKIYHGVLSFIVNCEESDKAIEYRVDTKHCHIDTNKKIIEFNAIKSNDIPGEWSASLKIDGSIDGLKKDIKTALNESLDIDIEDNEACLDKTYSISEILKANSLSDLLYAAADKLQDMKASTDDDVNKVVIDDIAAQLEQIIVEVAEISDNSIEFN